MVLRRTVLLLGLSFLLLGSAQVRCQEIEKLRSERQKHLEDIAYTEGLLTKKTTAKKSELSQVRLLSNQIRTREKLIGNIRQELSVIDRTIRSNSTEIELLERELKGLKDEYAKLIYKAYQTRKAYNKVQYILAASDFNQAYKRVKYMQQYSKFRKKQAAVIKEKSAELDLKVERLEEAKVSQSALLNDRRREVSSLNNKKRDKDQYISKLSKEEQELRRELENKRKARQRIEDEIKRILKDAMGENTDAEGLVLTPEMKIISSEFGKNKGRLPWPVERGVITSKYGKHKHEVLKLVEVDNKGVDLTTNPGEKIRAVFEGRISNVISIKGANLTIIIQHGEYFSVYQNIVNAKVKKGDLVQAKQHIGESYQVKGAGTSEIHFELWKGTSSVNPEIWLAR